MADIRKRVGKKGVTYQVRYPSKATKSGYAFASFNTLKEAREFREDSRGRAHSVPTSAEIQTVPQAIDKWLDICAKEGRDGRDPVTAFTKKTYEYRADMMRAYAWSKPLHEIKGPDIIEFRSWLLKTYSRDQARKVLSSLQSVIREMAQRGIIENNAAAGITVRADSRYDEPVVIPTVDDVHALLSAADRLANAKNKQTARTWRRYRPILYLAADTGMRPQEYLVVPKFNLIDCGIKVDRAIERGGGKISVTKTPAGRRFIDLSPDTFELVRHYADHHAVDNKHDLIFPTASGHWQSTDNWRKRGFYAVCVEAGLVETEIEDGVKVEKPKYKPYDLRHFFASLLIEQKVNLKRVQQLMGHRDIKTTLNVYGHLIEKAESERSKPNGLISRINLQHSCGESVANLL